MLFCLDAMNTQVHDTTGATPYELVFGQRARTVLFPTQQSAMVLEEDLADEGIDFDTSEKISLTEEDAVNGAKDTQQADMCATESQTIQSELLEKNDESDGIEEGIGRSNGNLTGRLREDALSTSLKHKKVKLICICIVF